MKVREINTEVLLDLVKKELEVNEYWCEKAWDNTYQASDAFMKIVKAEGNVSCMLGEHCLEVFYSFNGKDYATNDFDDDVVSKDNITDIIITVVKGAMNRHE